MHTLPNNKEYIIFKTTNSIGVGPLSDMSPFEGPQFTSLDVTPIGYGYWKRVEGEFVFIEDYKCVQNINIIQRGLSKNDIVAKYFDLLI